MSELDSPTRPLWTIAVLAGGRSAERDVSLKSGAAVTDALRAGGHRVIQLDPARDDLRSLDWRTVPAGPPTAAQSVAVDCVFNALHGAYGEDGEVQRLLESQNIPYTGADSAASALAFSKWAAKQCFLSHGIPTPAAVRVSVNDPAGFAQAAAETLGYPLVVKPDRQGSSIGVTIVPSRAFLDAALNSCFRFDTVGVLESAVLGEEWTVAVLDDESLPPIRIGTSREFYDYTAKYTASDTSYRFDEAPSPLIRTLSELGRAACKAVGTTGIARVDIRLDAQGRPFVLEVNTIPGMTDHSLVPKAAAEVGMSMTSLCEWAIASALRVHHARQNCRVLPDPQPTLLHRRAG